jgi:ubiquinone/menaquinone biosynthesis C-methylase UbiE
VFSDPKFNLKQFGIEKGMKVADLGVGAGFYTIEAAREVGDDGLVFAVDVQKDLASSVKLLADKEGLHNVEVIWGDIEKVGGTKIKEDSIDAVMASNVLFQLENKEGFVSEVSRILKSGGSVLVVDWMDSFAGLGPIQSHVVTQEKAEALFTEKGFAIEKRIDAGDHHYGFIARKA